jgi:hypothetical protein
MSDRKLANQAEDHGGRASGNLRPTATTQAGTIVSRPSSRRDAGDGQVAVLPEPRGSLGGRDRVAEAVHLQQHVALPGRRSGACATGVAPGGWHDGCAAPAGESNGRDHYRGQLLPLSGR